MRVAAVRIAKISLRKDDPTWRFALGGTPASDGFLVSVETEDGVQGFGSCAAATYYGVPRGGLADALELFGSALVGLDAADIAGAHAAMDRALKGHERAKASVDMALHDVVGKSLGVPVSTLLGGRTRELAPAIRILALKAPDAVAAGAAAHVAAGYRYLKIKLEGAVEVDVARVHAVRERVGPDVVLTADANQSYRPKDAIRALRRMEADGLTLIEQPVAASDLRGMRAVREAVSVLVEADEAANTLDEIARLLDAQAVDAINLKVTHVGGLRRAQAAVALCDSAGVRCRLGGGTVGSQLLAAATLHLYAATPSLGDPSEVAEWARLAADPAAGLLVDAGSVAVPATPGLGLDVTWPAEDGG